MVAIEALRNDQYFVRSESESEVLFSVGGRYSHST
jgi:hypothetical protein